MRGLSAACAYSKAGTPGFFRVFLLYTHNLVFRKHHKPQRIELPALFLTAEHGV